MCAGLRNLSSLLAAISATTAVRIGSHGHRIHVTQGTSTMLEPAGLGRQGRSRSVVGIDRHRILHP
ncbi:hypothetical protein PF005_g22320 [Phytophthora fragariae]|uniref:Secreted protein n=1 Tax=Phytophthora fragariae TaxID=53985 RepID=A0A6A4CHV8_9STRA|nr:hypothetical protein PF003_g39992 [Phytophthora fragariae]KAE8927313.1 hypothetical protein PF009_g22518 [Phytophthora fragariae]KAE8986231.1 hypothetical protein PF011_g20074 [Phytophthora fragariae]KAE9084310.1 hypothetical protein PF007_g21570 [Phytophthora fragariae]KAE9084972.1 hypothetical protein PF010_g20630 [Phytophthora fragariae]